MTRRQTSGIDKLIEGADLVLKTLSQGSARADRPSPAAQSSEAELNPEQRRHIAGLMRINGTERALPAANVACLLEQLGYGRDRRGIAVAVNGQVVPRRAWEEREVRADDEVEIVGAVQGG